MTIMCRIIIKLVASTILILSLKTVSLVSSFQAPYHQQIVGLPGVITSSTKISLPKYFVTSKKSTGILQLAEKNDEDWENAEDESSNAETIKEFLSEKFPSFLALLKKNDEIFAILNSNDTDEGYTLFAPTEKAFEELGEKKAKQMDDPRNLETIQKMGAFHFIDLEAVSYQRLKTEDWTKPKPSDGGPRPLVLQGVKTLAGEVPVGRAKEEGNFFLGLVGALKETGDPVIGTDGAKIIGSYTIKNTNCVIHEMDKLVSPNVLWRYCDQLRIPGV